MFAIGSNAVHGLRRTNADKRKAIEMLLADEEWAKKSDRWLADIACVSNKTVSTLRQQVCNLHTSKSGPTKKTGKDGKSYPSQKSASSEKCCTPADENRAADQSRNIAPNNATTEPNSPPSVIGAIKSRLENFVGELVDGQPPHVCMAVADFLETIADDLRK